MTQISKLHTVTDETLVNVFIYYLYEDQSESGKIVTAATNPHVTTYSERQLYPKNQRKQIFKEIPGHIQTKFHSHKTAWDEMLNHIK